MMRKILKKHGCFGDKTASTVARLVLIPVALVIVGPASAVQALNLGFGKPPLMELPVDGTQISVHPFKLEHSFRSSSREGFALLRRGVVDLDGAVNEVVRRSLLSPIVQMRAKTYSHGLSLHGEEKSREYTFYVNDLPICHYSVKAHVLKNNETLILGRVPNVDNIEPAPVSDWPSASDSIERGIKALRDEGHEFSSAKLIRHSRCYNVNGGNLMPMWDATIEIGGLPYQMVGDSYETVMLQPQYFDVAGKVQSYDTNVKTGSLKTFSIELNGDKTLSSEFFQTVLSDGSARANSDSHNFIYAANSPFFAEASVFSHANAQYEFVKSIGYTWVGPKPMLLEVHQTFSGKVNNALFRPAESTDTGKPTISVGDGDGQILGNLPTDSDVVAHEFGHHTVYRSLKSTSGESLILHEGLADFFAYSRTGDDCLGESICPNGSRACWVMNQCLRTANNDLNYKSDNYLGLAEMHLKSQLVSGMLWDMRKSNKIPGADLTLLVHKAVDYLQAKSDLDDLVIAMVTADKEAFGKKYGPSILEAASARGFTDVVGQIDLDKDVIPAMTSTGTVDNGSNVAPGGGTSSRSSKKGNEFCGVGSSIAATNGLTWGGLLLLILPILVLAGGKLVPVRVSPKKAPRQRR